MKDVVRYGGANKATALQAALSSRRGAPARPACRKPRTEVALIFRLLMRCEPCDERF